MWQMPHSEVNLRNPLCTDKKALRKEVHWFYRLESGSRGQEYVENSRNFHQEEAGKLSALTMALKYRVHVARSQKQEYQWLHKNEIKKRKTIFLKNYILSQFAKWKNSSQRNLTEKGQVKYVQVKAKTFEKNCRLIFTSPAQHAFCDTWKKTT